MEPDAAVKALAALGEPSRLAIFRLLVAAGPAGHVVGEIGAHLKLSPGTLSFHLKTLVAAGLIGATREGTFLRYSADFSAMQGLLSYLTDHCCGGHPERCLPKGEHLAT